MVCRRARASLSDYLDERMPLATMQRVRDHLSACPACRTEWEELVALKQILKAARTPQAPTEFWDLALRRVHEQRLNQTARRDVFRPTRWDVVWQRAPALAAGLAAVLTAILIPLSATLDVWDAPVLDTRAALSHHAAYSLRLPLTDRGHMTYLLSDARRRISD